MIFNNAQPIPPEAMLNKLLQQTKLNIHNDRMKEREAILGRYTGKEVSEPIDKFFQPEVKKLVNIAEQNILRRVTNRESLVYKDQPDTTFEPDTLPDEYSLTERWMAFKKGERRTNLLGTVLIHPVWRDDRLQWDIIHDYEILTTTDPFTPSAVIYPLNLHSASAQVSEEMLWVYWDSERHFLINGNGDKMKPAEDNAEMENPYGILPFISVHPDDQDDEYWVESRELDIVNVMDALNKGITEGRIAVRYAAGQRVVTGNNSDKDLQTGLEYILDLAEGSTYKHESTDSDFTGMIGMLKFDLKTAFENHGMGAEFTESTAEASGFSLMVRNLPLLENREDDAGRWRHFDNQVYSVEQVMMEHHQKPLPKERTLDYPEVTFPLTASEQQAQDDWDLLHGMTTEAQILMRRDPDGYAKEADAQKVIDENKAKNVVARPSARPQLQGTQ